MTFLQICTNIYLYGTCFAYVVYIVGTFENRIIVSELIEKESSFLDNHISFLVSVIMGVYLPLSMFKGIENISVFTYISLALLFTTIACIIYTAIIAEKFFSSFNTLNLLSFADIPLSFGIFSFSYDINGVITEVHAVMEDKSQFPKALRT